MRTQLQQTSESQRYTKKEAEHIKLNILNEKTSERVDIATSKRRQQMSDVQQKLKERNYKKLKDWADRAVSMENEARRREHEDRLKLLSVSGNIIIIVLLLLTSVAIEACVSSGHYRALAIFQGQRAGLTEEEAEPSGGQTITGAGLELTEERECHHIKGMHHIAIDNTMELYSIKCSP